MTTSRQTDILKHPYHSDIMAPKRIGRPPAQPKGKTPQQQQIDQLPLLKKPLEQIGLQIKVPGAFWEGRMSDEEKEKLYACSWRCVSRTCRRVCGTASERWKIHECVT